jgi:hypothetical protein
MIPQAVFGPEPEGPIGRRDRRRNLGLAVGGGNKVSASLANSS